MSLLADNGDNSKGSSNMAEHVQQLLQLWRYYTNILPTEDTTVKNIATDICCLLSKTNSIEALSVFLNELPDAECYWTDENILRARVEVALFKRETETVKKILKVCLFFCIKYEVFKIESAVFTFSPQNESDF